MSSFWRVSSDLEGFLADFGRLAWLRRSSRHLGSSSVILLKLIRDWVRRDDNKDGWAEDFQCNGGVLGEISDEGKDDGLYRGSASCKW